MKKLLSLFCCIIWTIGSHAQQKPNIIYILADDMGYGDLGCYGQTKIKTPNIDRLAQQGKRYTEFYAGSTVCAPSRAALMTGRHTGRVSVRGNGEFPLPAEEKIIPEILKEYGYTTAMMGKWGLGLPGTSGSPEKRGWDYFSGFVHHIEGHFQYPDSAWQIQQKELKKIDLPDQTNVNEWFADQALDFIRKQKDGPFFLYLSFTIPHAELVAPAQYMKLYLDENGESIFAPEQAHGTGNWYGPQPYPKAAYAAMVTQMDDYVGKLMDLLNELELDDNTVLIFTSDNGTHKEGGRTLADAMEFFKSSGPFKGVKRDLYEGGIRAPFIVRWPGKVQAGTQTAMPATAWDMLATFAALAGANADPQDGVSQIPVWTDRISLKERASLYERKLYWEFYEEGYKQALRKGNWKAIRFYKDGRPQRTELYQLSEDPGEQQNLAAQNRRQVRKMEKYMDKLREPSGNPAFQIK